uniref:Uncharacterized protein n=4 Tax=Oryza TaxID=4527 RepID=Q10FS8_ORYSJ|nr:hypothetical protein [Oryza sativa Japonica Group]ABF97979.1 hypothetical protein LOC_Os03g45440 [Oryza sativa Japonica Group]
MSMAITTSQANANLKAQAEVDMGAMRQSMAKLQDTLRQIGIKEEAALTFTSSLWHHSDGDNLQVVRRKSFVVTAMAPGSRPHWRVPLWSLFFLAVPSLPDLPPSSVGKETEGMGKKFGKAAQLQLNDGPNPQEAAAAARVRAHRARRMYKILKEEDFVC